ncbi:MAG: phosphoribosylglycinamide formyltransferase [Gemmatimonadota bacterium]
MSVRLAVFASGGGTNLQALLDTFQNRSNSPVRIVLVVADRAEAGALDRARKARIDNVVIEAAGRPLDLVARELLAVLESADVDLIALAGYLRLIPPVIVKRFRQRMVNIHPALLPAFGGKGMYGIRVHQAVIASGCTLSGATVHLVDEDYDQGLVIAQWPVPVLPGDDAATLAARVLRVEHLLFPAAIEALALSITANQTTARPGPQQTDASFSFDNMSTPTAQTIRRALGLD